MKIRNFAHKGLQGFCEDDSAKRIPAAAVDKLRDQLTFLELMTDADELHKVPVWKVHQLKETAGRSGASSLRGTGG